MTTTSSMDPSSSVMLPFVRKPSLIARGRAPQFQRRTSSRAQVERCAHNASQPTPLLNASTMSSSLPLVLGFAPLPSLPFSGPSSSLFSDTSASTPSGTPPYIAFTTTFSSSTRLTRDPPAAGRPNLFLDCSSRSRWQPSSSTCAPAVLTLPLNTFVKTRCESPSPASPTSTYATLSTVATISEAVTPLAVGVVDLPSDNSLSSLPSCEELSLTSSFELHPHSCRPADQTVTPKRPPRPYDDVEIFEDEVNVSWWDQLHISFLASCAQRKVRERVARQQAIQEPRVLRPEPPRRPKDSITITPYRPAWRDKAVRPEEPAPTSPPPLYRSIGFAAPEAEVHQFLPSTEEQFSNVVPLDEPEGAERLQRDFPDFPTFDELEMYLYAQACIQSSSDLQQDLEPPSLCLKSAFDEPSPDLSDEDPLNGLFASESSAFDGVWVDDLPFAPNTCPHDQPVPPEGADQVLNRRGEKQKKMRRVPRAHSENKVKRVYEGRRKRKAVGGRKMRL